MWPAALPAVPTPAFTSAIGGGEFAVMTDGTQVLVAASKLPSGSVPGTGQVASGSMSRWSTAMSTSEALGQTWRFAGRTTRSNVPP